MLSECWRVAQAAKLMLCAEAEAASLGKGKAPAPGGSWSAFVLNQQLWFGFNTVVLRVSQQVFLTKLKSPFQQLLTKNKQWSLYFQHS